MKTIFEDLIGQFVAIAHPAGGWFKITSGEKKRKTAKALPAVVISPDCFNLRGGSSKKGTARRTPAP